MHIAIIGCGNMGAAIAARLSRFNKIFLFDHHLDKTEALQKNGHGIACKDLPEAIKQAELIILAIKPQSLESIILPISECAANQPIVSLLSGATIQKLEECFPSHQVVRMMPNLAITYGEGLMALSTNQAVKNGLENTLSQLCEPLGKVYWIPESKMNAFTALAGSGPAFIFAMLEAMIDAGISMGFNSTDAQEIVQQMIKGSLELWKESGKHLGELKWQITSPGGTTIAGLKKFEEHAVRAGIINTFIGAYNRAEEMSK